MTELLEINTEPFAALALLGLGLKEHKNMVQFVYILACTLGHALMQGGAMHQLGC